MKHNNSCKLYIVPNPVKGTSQIEVTAVEGATVKIYSATGQVMSNDILQSDSYTKTVSSNEFSQGVYMVIVFVDGKPVKTQKMVVVK
jgi:hypothetical protein